MRCRKGKPTINREFNRFFCSLSLNFDILCNSNFFNEVKDMYPFVTNDKMEYFPFSVIKILKAGTPRLNIYVGLWKIG